MTRSVVLLAMLIGMSCCIVSIENAYGFCNVAENCGSKSVSLNNSPIVISRDPSSSQINIVIHAPDFNSNSYSIDTIGEDGSSVIISTREASIPYRLVETGPDTGDFAGYVILSSTTSVCSPVCGPTDGFLAAGGDDAVTVSFTYASGHTISSTSYDPRLTLNSSAIPEFSYAGFGLFVGITYLILVSKVNFIR